jgi:hypothetical protein
MLQKKRIGWTKILTNGASSLVTPIFYSTHEGLPNGRGHLEIVQFVSSDVLKIINNFMRCKYQIAPSDHLSFRFEYHRKFSKRIMPIWVRWLFWMLLLFFTFLAVFWITRDVIRSIVLVFVYQIVALIFTGIYNSVYRRLVARYIADIPNSDQWLTEIIDDRLVTENLGLIFSFPLSSLSDVYEEGQFIYFDFSSLGVTRIPFSAFESVSERNAFISQVESRKVPSRSSS